MIAEKRFMSMLRILWLSFFATLFGFPTAPGIHAQEPKPKRPVELLLDERDPVTRAAVCRWAVEPPVLDGKLDDRCWKSAAVIDRFASYWKNPKEPIKGIFSTPIPGRRRTLPRQVDD